MSMQTNRQRDRNSNVNYTKMRSTHSHNMINFADESIARSPTSPSTPIHHQFLSPSQIRSRDTHRFDNNNEVRIPLRVMVSKGFDEDRHLAKIETVFCSCCSLLVRFMVTAALGSFLFGFNIALLNTSLKSIAIDFGWCEMPGDTTCMRSLLFMSFTNTAVFIGGALGSMTGGKFVFIGRRVVIMLTMLVLSVGLITSVLADSFTVLVWARLIVGYGVGVISVVVPIYMSEMSPQETRGFYCSFHQLFLTMGIFIAVLIGLPLSLSGLPTTEEEKLNYKLPLFNRVWWRVMLGLGFIPVIICAYLFAFVMKFETPHYYVDNNFPQEARKVLKHIQNKENVDQELEMIIKSCDDAELAKEKGLTFCKAIWLPLYRRVILIGILLAGLQQLTGITVFIASSNAIFTSANLSPKLATITSTIMTLLNFLMTIPAIYLIDYLGRRTLMQIGTLGMGFSILPGTIALWVDPDGQATSWLAIAGSIAFILFFSVTYGPVLWVYLFEIYPMDVKGVATGVATATNWAMGIFTVFAAQFIPIRINFTIFCIMSFLTFVLVYTCMRETKGRALDRSPYWD